MMCALALAACGKEKPEGAEDGETSEHAQENPLIAMQSEAARHDPRAQIFLTKGCPQCHPITKLQIVSPTSTGPDLSVAFHDVRQRFSTSLDSFLASPTGTMQIVFSAQIKLSPAERDSIFHLLRDLYNSP
ncbi:MAG: hypothetical protein A2083_00855 [Gemmatimonadetes bacterium GWC2_71_9]|nr:MAG: hypothetical protein A2083_00855 [Gemmatimonadetes bacterium GWC2_71_9]